MKVPFSLETCRTRLMEAVLLLTGAFLAWVLVTAHRYYHLAAIAVFLAAYIFHRLLDSRGRSPAGAAIDVPAALRTSLAAVGIAWIVAIGTILRFAWALYIRPVPFSDFATYYRFADRLSEGVLRVLGTSKSPITVIYYSAIFKVLDNSLFFVYLVNSLLGALQIYLVYALSKALFANEHCSKLSALVVALFPSIIMYTGVVSSEMPFTTLLLLVLLVSARIWRKAREMPNAPLLTLGFLLGILIAAMHLCRNIGIILGVWLIALMMVFLAVEKRRKALLFASIFIGAFLVLAPQIRYNYKTYRVLSINSSRWSSLNLLMGTSRTSNGKFNPAERRRVTRKYKFKGKTFRSATRYARRLALERIARDPSGFMKFALTKKFREMWGRDSYGVTFLSPPSDRIKKPPTRKQDPSKRGFFKIAPDPRGWAELADRYYFVIIALALSSLALVRRAAGMDGMLLTMIAGIVAIVFSVHIFLEVQARYHFYVLFLLAILAGGVLQGRSKEYT